MHSFDVYFLGEMLTDTDPAAVRRSVAQLFKVSEDAVERLFSGKPLRVKQGVDAEAASRYRAAFRDAGALVQIVPSGDPPPAARPSATQPADVSPGVPEQIPAAPQPAAGGAGFSLAEPGATIDLTSPPPPAAIDTSALSVQPANTGSLEDCKVEKPPRPIPDISHLKIVDD